MGVRDGKSLQSVNCIKSTKVNSLVALRLTYFVFTLKLIFSSCILHFENFDEIGTELKKIRHIFVDRDIKIGQE